jgi:hypothetical protein
MHLFMCQKCLFFGNYRHVPPISAIFDKMQVNPLSQTGALLIFPPQCCPLPTTFGIELETDGVAWIKIEEDDVVVELTHIPPNSGMNEISNSHSSPFSHLFALKSFPRQNSPNFDRALELEECINSDETHTPKSGRIGKMTAGNVRQVKLVSQTA